MRRIALLPLVVLAVLLFGFAGAGPAAAEDPIPPPAFPSGLSSPEDVGNDVGDAQTESGPTYEVTPGSAGTELPAPQDAQIRDARAALDRLAGKKAKTQVATPTAVEAHAPAADGTDWWLIGSGVMVLLVLTEIGRINLAGARHKRPVE